MSKEISEDLPDDVEKNLAEDTEDAESDESAPVRKEPFVDQEMADAYGFTPQQAKAMSFYL